MSEAEILRELQRVTSEAIALYNKLSSETKLRFDRCWSEQYQMEGYLKQADFAVSYIIQVPKPEYA